MGAVHVVILASASDAWRYALAVFLVLTGLGLTFALVRVAATLGRVNNAIDGLLGEVLPMLGKVSASLDHVNDELDKVGHITDSAVDATDKVDHAVRAVSDALSRPAKAAAGFTEGVSHAFETLRARRDRRGGVV
jgi:uncharacterized protein YoxC